MAAAPELLAKEPDVEPVDVIAVKRHAQIR